MSKERIVVDGVEYVKKQSVCKDQVLVRTYSAGVHYGELEQRDGKEVTLKNARRIWYWDGACSLSQIAVDGLPNNGNQKVSVTVPNILLTEAIEIIPMTETAIKNLSEVKEWKK